MDKLPKLSILVIAAATAVSLGACSKSTTTTPTPPDTSSSSSPSSSASPMSQWATAATATSNYGAATGASWNASNAVGPPEVTTCADNGKAWAALNRNTIETLTLRYALPVVPQTINISESYNPGFISKVTVTGETQTATVYSGVPALASPCPKVLNIIVKDVPFKVDTVAVTVDQTALNNWAEIDAVQLTGTP